MRFLGFVFVLILLLAAVGYFRGWFSVTTTHAGARSDVTVAVDKNMIGDDAQAAASKLGALSAKAVEKVKSLGRTVSASESELDATVKAIDSAARDLTVTANSQTIDLHVPSDVPITRDGSSVGFDQLHPATRVTLSFKQAGEDRKLSRIVILR